MKRYLEEFKAFAMRGNVIDLAVAVVIGGAFGKIVSSLVDDIVMPLVGAVTGKVDFSDLVWHVTGTVSVRYGMFISAIITFIIVAAAIFAVIKVMNTLKKEEAAAPTPSKPTRQEELLAEIRDLLKK